MEIAQAGTEVSVQETWLCVKLVVKTSPSTFCVRYSLLQFFMINEQTR